MALPLPAGWTDTGVTGSYTASGSVSILIRSGVTAQLNHWSIHCGANSAPAPAPNCPGGHEYDWQVITDGPLMYDPPPALAPHPSNYQLEFSFSCASLYFYPPRPDKTSATYAMTETGGPFRLGVQYQLIGPSQNPNFAQKHYKIVYQWFADDQTVVNTSLGPATAPTYYYANTNAVATGPAPTAAVSAGASVGQVNFSASADSTVALTSDSFPILFATFSGLTINGMIVDTSEITNVSTYSKVVGGSGSFTAYINAVVPSGQTAGGGGTATAPYQFNYDLAVRHNGGALSGAHLLDGFVTTPVAGKTYPQADYLPEGTFTYTVPQLSWASHYKSMQDINQNTIPIQFTIEPVWEAAQVPALESADASVPIKAAPALSSPVYNASQVGQKSYQPVTLTLQQSLGIDIPDGNRPSNWVGTTGVTVIQNTTNTVFRIASTASGPSVSRTYAVNWPNYIDSTKPDYAIDGYRYLRHNRKDYAGGTQTVYPEDVWWWGTYSWLKVDITAPAAGTLTLTVNYIDVDVSDPHDGSTAPTVTQTSRSVTYSVVVTASSQTVWVDLLFPTSGGPTYLGRISSIQISGFSDPSSGTWDYTLSGMSLYARTAPYFKTGFGVPVQRGDYSALMLAVDGAFCFGNLPDQANKPDETGAHGGGVRYIAILISSGVIQDSQKSLQTFWTEMNDIEGLTASYSASAFNAANKDSFGSALGPELAQWLWEILPYASSQFVLSGGYYTYSPPCSPVCSQIVITSGINYHIVVDWSIGGALEGLTTTNGVRVSGVMVNAVDTSTGQIVATGASDSQGYVVVTPVPANGSEDYTLSA